MLNFTSPFFIFITLPTFSSISFILFPFCSRKGRDKGHKAFSFQSSYKQIKPQFVCVRTYPNRRFTKMGYKVCLLVLTLVLAMVAKSSAKLHEATWGLSRYEDDNLINSANSKIGDLIGEENEMMMDSESSRRTLRGRGKYIGYAALRKNSVPCGRRGQSYYNCQNRQNANPYKRGCINITRCARG